MSVVARTSRRLLSILTLALPVAAGAQATWDDLPNGNFASTPLPYHGFNVFYGDGTFGSGSALQYSTLGAYCHSGTNCAYNANGNTVIRVEAPTTAAVDAFTFSGFLTGGYPGFATGPGNALVQGFVGGSSTPAFSTTLGVTDGVWTAASFTSMNVNKILITGVAPSGNAAAGYLLLDDVTFGQAASGPITSAPEPATYLLVAGGLLALGAARRRRA